MQLKTGSTNTSTSRATSLIQTLLAAILVCGFLTFASLPKTAYADNKTVAITQSDSTATIQSNIQTAINAAGTGFCVTVTGSKTAVDNQIKLDIKPGVTVIWKAEYSGALAEFTDEKALLYLDGLGAFKVADGGSVTSSNYAAIYIWGDGLVFTVGGGVVRSENFWAIIDEGLDGTVEIEGGEVTGAWGIYTNSNHSFVRVKGGRVVTDGEHGIFNTSPHGYVEVSGGYVANSGGPAIEVTGSNSTSLISGGTVTSSLSDATVVARYIEVTSEGLVQATGPGHAIKAVGLNSNVKISGGAVGACSGKAILCDDSSTVSISAGFVFAYGNVSSSYDDVVLMFAGWPDVSGTGIVCAWNKSAGKTIYTAGTTEHLTFNPSAMLRWESREDLSGIEYANGAYSAFYQVQGVTVLPITVSFDTDEGSFIDPQAVVYGHNATPPADPTRNGYVFAGWYTDEALTTPYNFDSNVYESFTLFARWESADEAGGGSSSQSGDGDGENDGGATSPGSSQPAGILIDFKSLLIGILAIVAIASTTALVVSRRKAIKPGGGTGASGAGAVSAGNTESGGSSSGTIDSDNPEKDNDTTG